MIVWPRSKAIRSSSYFPSYGDIYFMVCPLYRDSIVVQISNLLLERRNENESGSFYKIIFTFGKRLMKRQPPRGGFWNGYAGKISLNSQEILVNKYCNNAAGCRKILRILSEQLHFRHFLVADFFTDYLVKRRL